MRSSDKLSRVLDSLFPDPTRYHKHSGCRIRENRPGGGVRIPKGLSGGQKLKGVARKDPEVVVKISNTAIRTQSHLGKAISYISRHGNLELQDQDGQFFFGKSSSDDIAEARAMLSNMGEQESRFSEAKRIVLSMPEGTPEEGFKKACRQVATEVFKNYGWVMAFHLPSNDPKTGQPHCHIIVRTLGADGRRLHISNGERDRLREFFATCLRANGIAANATPRWVRGRVHRSLSQSDYHNLRKVSVGERARIFAMAKKRKKTQALNRNFASRQQEVLNCLADGKPIEDHAGIVKAKARRSTLNNLMREAIDELAAGDQSDQVLSERLKTQMKSLDPVESIQQKALRKLRESVRQKVSQKLPQRQQTDDKGPSR